MAGVGSLGAIGTQAALSAKYQSNLEKGLYGGQRTIGEQPFTLPLGSQYETAYSPPAAVPRQSMVPPISPEEFFRQQDPYGMGYINE